MNKYDKNDKESILTHAKKLIGKSFNDVLNQKGKSITIEEPSFQYNKRHKGGLGEIIEEHHFYYRPDNISEADFPEADVELKVTPFRTNKNKTISAKERLSLTMINYNEIVEQSFFDNNVWNKMQNILLIYYEWEKDVMSNLEYIIKFVHMYSPSDKDLDIIIQDYNKIKNKVINGLAHELSEGDTLYLGAAPKGSGAKDVTTQPFSNIKAKRRAFTFKNSYMTYLLRNDIQKEKETESVVKKDNVINFEEFIINKLNRYINKDLNVLFKEHFGGKIPRAKHKYSMLINRLLGVNTRYIEEFEKANIEVKTIRRQSNGKVKESMSFPAFIINELITEQWEDSNIYNLFLERKFLFVVFDEYEDGFKLSGSTFWNMPEKIVNTTLKKEWLRAQNTFIEGVQLTPVQQKNRIIVRNNLPKSSNTEILHVRPHASLSYYVINNTKYGSGKITNSDLLPNGNRMTKQCFWLNNHYIEKIIKEV